MYIYIFLLVKISRSHLNLEEKNVKLFYGAETCIAALMYSWFSQQELILYNKKKITLQSLWFCCSLKNMKKKWMKKVSFLVWLNPESFSGCQVGSGWTWNAFSGWQKCSHHRVFVPSWLVRRGRVSASQLYFRSSASWARTGPVELLFFLTFFFFCINVVK